MKNYGFLWTIFIDVKLQYLFCHICLKNFLHLGENEHWQSASHLHPSEFRFFRFFTWLFPCCFLSRTFLFVLASSRFCRPIPPLHPCVPLTSPSSVYRLRFPAKKHHQVRRTLLLTLTDRRGAWGSVIPALLTECTIKISLAHYFFALFLYYFS